MLKREVEKEEGKTLVYVTPEKLVTSDSHRKIRSSVLILDF